jgi:putative DNA-invertase from lambdoid prophage Rac
MSSAAAIEGKAQSEGWKVAHIFADTCSGSPPLGERPEGLALLEVLQPGDRVIASKPDRLFRSALDALTVVEDFHAAGIHLFCSMLAPTTSAVTVRAA